MAQNTENVLKDELHKTVPSASIAAANVIFLYSLKDIEEEVQYAMANHHSYLSPRSKQAFMLYGILNVVFLNATSSGSDSSLMGSINAESQYKNFFYLKDTGSSTEIVFIFYNAASTIGCAFGGPIMDHFERRIGTQSGCLFTLNGAVFSLNSSIFPPI